MLCAILNQGGSYVHRGGGAVRRVLAALSRLLRLPVHQSQVHLVQIRSAHFPGFLLAGHVQRHDQPSRLLLDEC